MSKISQRVAARFVQSSRFDLEGELFEDLATAAQEAEFMHAENGRPHQVKAAVDDEHGMFRAGEVVYTSKGDPDDEDETPVPDPGEDEDMELVSVGIQIPAGMTQDEALAKAKALFPCDTGAWEPEQEEEGWMFGNLELEAGFYDSHPRGFRATSPDGVSVEFETP